MDVQSPEQFARSFEQGGRVMIAADDDHMTAGRAGQAMEKAVVEGQGAAARGGGVEDIPGHQQGVDGLAFDQIGQPVQEPGLLLVPGAAMKTMAQVPIRGVNQTHGRQDKNIGQGGPHNLGCNQANVPMA